MTHLAVFQDAPQPDIGTTTVIVIGVVVAAIILIPVGLSVRKIFRDLAKTKALLANGEPARAKILKLRDTGTTLNDNPKVELVLEVYPTDRAPYQVETMCYVSRLRIPQVQTGNIVAVKIDRQDATNVVLDLA